MTFRLLITILAALPSLLSAANIVCYFTSWSIYRNGNGKFQASDINGDLCTHVVYAYVGLNENATLTFLDDWDVYGLDELDHLSALKDDYPDLKILISVGGWNVSSEIFSAVAGDADKRATLINNATDFITSYGFDGVDVFWEYPGERGGDQNQDPNNFVILLGELRARLDQHGYILSGSVTGSVDTAATSYRAEPLSHNVDMLNIMTYDLHGDWDEFVGHSSPLYASHLDAAQGQDRQNVDAQIQYWIDQGVDPSIINLGVAFFGRTFTLESASDDDLYAPISGPGDKGPYMAEDGALAYNEICEYDPDWDYVWDDEQQVPHIVSENQWAGYENIQSVEIKANYAKMMGLGGVLAYTIDNDDFKGTCGDGPYPLLQKLNDVLNG